MIIFCDSGKKLALHLVNNYAQPAHTTEIPLLSPSHNKTVYNKSPQTVYDCATKFMSSTRTVLPFVKVSRLVGFSPRFNNHLN